MGTNATSDMADQRESRLRFSSGVVGFLVILLLLLVLLLLILLLLWVMLVCIVNIATVLLALLFGRNAPTSTGWGRIISM
jgi:uncharacterized membrane protein